MGRGQQSWKGKQEDEAGLQGFRTRFQNWSCSLPASTWASPRSLTHAWPQGLLSFPALSSYRCWLCSGKGSFSQALLSWKADSQRTSISAEDAGPGDGDGRWLRIPGVHPPLLSSPEASAHQDPFGNPDAMPACLPFGPELVPPSHPLKAPSHKKTTKPRGEHIYLIWGVGYCCLCQCVWGGRETTRGTSALE